MAIYSSLDHPRPKRKSKPKTNAWETTPDFMALKSAIVNGKMRPAEEKWMYIEEDLFRKKFNMKWPTRTALDTLKRFIKSLGLETEYFAEKYETPTPGRYMVTVAYVPPSLEVKGKTPRQRLIAVRQKEEAEEAKKGQ